MVVCTRPAEEVETFLIPQVGIELIRFSGRKDSISRWGTTLETCHSRNEVRIWIVAK